MRQLCTLSEMYALCSQGTIPHMTSVSNLLVTMLAGGHLPNALVIARSYNSCESYSGKQKHSELLQTARIVLLLLFE